MLVDPRQRALYHLIVYKLRLSWETVTEMRMQHKCIDRVWNCLWAEEEEFLGFMHVISFPSCCQSTTVLLFQQQCNTPFYTWSHFKALLLLLVNIPHATWATVQDTHRPANRSSRCTGSSFFLYSDTLNMYAWPTLLHQTTMLHTAVMAACHRIWSPFCSSWTTFVNVSNTAMA